MIDNNDYMHHLEKVIRLKQACIIPNQTLKSIKCKYSISNDDTNTNNSTKSIDRLKLLKLNKVVKDVSSNIGDKTIIFSYFRNEIRYLYTKLKNKLNIDYIDGSTSSTKKLS